MVKIRKEKVKKSPDSLQEIKTDGGLYSHDRLIEELTYLEIDIAEHEDIKFIKKGE